jgi:hypothetical protein
MEPYPDNSYKSREESTKTNGEKPALRVVSDSSRVIRRRPPMGRRFKETFFGSDEQSFMGGLEHLISDVVLPTISEFQGIVSAVETVNRMLHGEGIQPRRTSAGRPNNNVRTMPVNYGRYSQRDKPQQRVGRNYDRHNFDDIILPTFNEVREIIRAMEDDIEEYEFVTLRDLYEMIGVAFSNADERWGWSSVEGAHPKRVSSGYLLVLPAIEPRG